MRETFLPDDPRRTLLEQAHYLPLDALAPEDGPTPDKVEAMYSIRTGNVYVKRPTAQSCPQLASNIAHELHHMQLDHGESINRMQECDRERVAHAREAKDLGRMIAAVPAGSADAERWLLAFELQQAQARSLSAMYNSKFELFRLVQALDRVDHLRDMTVLYPLYERCIEIAQKPLATEHREELTLLEEMSTAARGTLAEPLISAALQGAREAVEACVPLDATVARIRAGQAAQAKR